MANPVKTFTAEEFREQAEWFSNYGDERKVLGEMFAYAATLAQAETHRRNHGIQYPEGYVYCVVTGNVFKQGEDGNCPCLV